MSLLQHKLNGENCIRLVLFEKNKALFELEAKRGGGGKWDFSWTKHTRQPPDFVPINLLLGLSLKLNGASVLPEGSGP